MTLDREDVDAIALRVAEVLEERGLVASLAPSLISAAAAATRIGRSRDFVYEHADDLGAVRLGDGPRPRLAFDPRRLDEWVSARSTGGRSVGRELSAPTGNRRPRRKSDSGKPLDLLPIAADNGRSVTPTNGPGGALTPRGPATRNTPSPRDDRSAKRTVSAGRERPPRSLDRRRPDG